MPTPDAMEEFVSQVVDATFYLPTLNKRASRNTIRQAAETLVAARVEEYQQQVEELFNEWYGLKELKDGSTAPADFRLALQALAIEASKETK